MPHVIIISGANGAGKSTTAPALLQNAVHIDDFVNADVIAQGLSAFQPEKAAIDAGRIMLKRIKSLACVFRLIPNADFGVSRTLIPDSPERSFRFYPNAKYGLSRTPISV